VKKTFLTVIIPCYNEEANLKRGVLKEVADYLKKQKYSWEVLISDDGSTDQGQELVEEFIKKRPGFRLLKNKHGGKAFALRAGVKKAKGKIILTTDMDQSTPIKELEKLLPWFKKGYQVVIGSRGLKREGFSWYRQWLITPGFRILRGLFILPKVTDTQCGFKAYEAGVIKKIFPKLEVFAKSEPTKGWRVSAFDVEILFLAKKWGYRIKEVVVSWRDEDVSTTKDRDFFSESKNMATEVWRVRLNDWRGKYDSR
jgi:dolichyl-phosphate beta-glucosyltransferase